MDIQSYCEYLVQWIKKQVKLSGSSGVVVGVSGGVDSAVVAVLAKRACPNNCTTVFLPCYSDNKFKKQVEMLDQKFNLNTLSLPLNKSFDAFKDLFHSQGFIDHHNITQMVIEGNMKARLRMVTLYYLAQLNKSLVVGTDNASEWYTGYFTKFGDGGADLAPLIHLVKSDVYKLAEYLEVPRIIIDAAPSADLYPNQTDEKEMGFTYKQLEQYLKGIPIDSRIVQKIQKWHAQSQHKRSSLIKPIKKFSLIS